MDRFRFHRVNCLVNPARPDGRAVAKDDMVHVCFDRFAGRLSFVKSACPSIEGRLPPVDRALSKASWDGSGQDSEPAGALRVRRPSRLTPHLPVGTTARIRGSSCPTCVLLPAMPNLGARALQRSTLRNRRVVTQFVDEPRVSLQKLDVLAIVRQRSADEVTAPAFV